MKLLCSRAGQAGAAHVFVLIRHLLVQQRPGEGGQEPLQTHLLGVVAAPQQQQELPELPLHPQPRHGTFPLRSLAEPVSEEKAHRVILSLRPAYFDGHFVGFALALRLGT